LAYQNWEAHASNCSAFALGTENLLNSWGTQQCYGGDANNLPHFLQKYHFSAHWLHRLRDLMTPKLKSSCLKSWSGLDQSSSNHCLLHVLPLILLLTAAGAAFQTAAYELVSSQPLQPQPQQQTF
jgi:hypothetical protein